jgi:hypothetical protein
LGSASIGAWRSLLEGHGYDFITTERSGTNAFFIDPAHFPPGYSRTIQRVDFRMNYSDQSGLTRPTQNGESEFVCQRLEWQEQYEMIRALPVVQPSGG